MKPTTHALLQAQTRARRAADIVKRKKHAALKEAVVAAALRRHVHAGIVPDAFDLQLDTACDALDVFEKGY